MLIDIFLINIACYTTLQAVKLSGGKMRLNSKNKGSNQMSETQELATSGLLSVTTTLAILGAQASKIPGKLLCATLVATSFVASAAEEIVYHNEETAYNSTLGEVDSNGVDGEL